MSSTALQVVLVFGGIFWAVSLAFCGIEYSDDGGRRRARLFLAAVFFGWILPPVMLIYFAGKLVRFTGRSIRSAWQEADMPKLKGEREETPGQLSVAKESGQLSEPEHRG